MDASRLTDHQLLIAIAEAGAAFFTDPDAAERRSEALNEAGERRWGQAEMDELADLVETRRMSSDEFVAWAREHGQAWLDDAR